MVAGECYCMVGNNRSDVVLLYRSKGITGMRLYSPRRACALRPS
jgi:hypothetical protein